MLTTLTSYFFLTLDHLGKILLLILPLLLSVAYLTLAERRLIGLMQLRRGPNVTGPFGLLQPIADAIKLLSKELIIPDKSDKLLFLLAPVITFSTALLGWAAIPVSATFVIADLNVAVLYVMATLSLGVYGIIIAGWASNSIYAFLGAVRSAAQMISYEIVMGLCILCVIAINGSLSLREIVLNSLLHPWYIDALLLPVALIFFISILAETNRHPFDLPEAESELVAGYHVEYSSMAFAMFFLGEYANMIIMSALMILLFFGGWLPPFGLQFLSAVPGVIWFAAKVSLSLFVFIWVRAALPRYRYDQLMRLGWKNLLPLAFGLFCVISALTFALR